MGVTILAIGFLLFVVFLTFFGYRVISRKAKDQQIAAGREKCSICGTLSPREMLVERAIGDYKILYFCRGCIAGLQSDAADAARN